jgi:O-antigen/teichoic acid export membrane protein
VTNLRKVAAGYRQKVSSLIPAKVATLGLQTGVLLAVGAVDRGLALLGSILIARYFAPDDLGIIGPALTLSLIATRLTDLGLSIIVQRETAKYSEASQELVSNSFGLRLALNVLMMIFVLIYAFLTTNSQDAIIVVMLAGLTGAFSGWTGILNALFTGKLNTQHVALNQFIYRLLYISSIGVVITLQLGKIALLIGLVIAALTQTFMAVLTTRLNYFPLRLSYNHKIMRDLLTESWPLGIATIMSVTYDRIDMLIASWFLPAAMVGNYFAAYSLFTGVLLFANVFNTIALSVMAKKFGESLHATRTAFKRALAFMFVAGSFFATVLFFSSDFLVRFLYTDTYSLAAECLKYLSPALIFIFTNNLAGVTMNAIGHQKATMLVTSSGVALNVALNMMLIPIYGVLAAALTTVATEAMICFIALAYLFRVFRRDTQLKGSLTR